MEFVGRYLRDTKSKSLLIAPPDPGATVESLDVSRP